jgi:hypothetical protein
MNIDSTPPATRPEALELRTAKPAASEAGNASPSTDKSAATDATTQVDLSRTSKLMAKNDATATAKTSDTTAGSDSTGSITEQIPVKQAQSFVYGALGLDRPDEAPKKEDSFYTAGKWLSAAGTAGMVISLLV